ncbi:MAG: Hpt domain-containing protein [bacterium]|nr:Hpt domain-containing protein [bacterium]
MTPPRRRRSRQGAAVRPAGGVRRRAIVACGLALVTLLFTASCVESEPPISLRGEWELRAGPSGPGSEARPPQVGAQFSGNESEQGAMQRVNLPAADLKERIGLEDRRGWAILRKRLPTEIDALFRRGVPVALNLGMASDVFQVYLNDTLAGGRGQADPYEPGYFRTLAVDLPGAAAHRDGQPNYLTIALFTDGAYPLSVLGPALEIGPAQSVYAIYYQGEIIVFALLTIYFIIGAYHLLLASRRPGELYNLYFGIFTVFLAGYWFFDTELRGIVFGEAVITGMLTEHLILYNLGPVFLLFLSHLFYRRHSLVALVVWGFFLAMCVVALLGSFPVQRLVLKVWQASVVPLMLYIIFYVVRAWRQGRPDAGFVVFGVLFFLAATLHDILYNAGIFRLLANAIPGLPEYVPPVSVASKAFLLVVLGVAGTLANRFARVHTESERLNVELEDRVQARTLELREAQRETDDILATVQEGLFLLYRASGGGLTTGMQYSRRLESILGMAEAEDKKIGGRDFVGLIEPLLIPPDERYDDESAAGDIDRREPREILDSTTKYLDLMFAGNISATMLNKLNPLRDIRMRLANGERRDMQFSFYRLDTPDAGGDPASPELEARDSRKDPQLMAVVIDVTDQKELSRKLLLEREKSEAERIRLYAVLRTDPAELSGFIRDCADELKTAREACQAQDRDALFRAVHAMKGDAGMLDLQFFADRAHDCETMIEAWNPAEQEAPPPEIEARLGGLEGILSDIRGDLERMQNFRESYGEKSPEEGGDEAEVSAMLRALERLSDRMSARLAKPVQLLTNEFTANAALWNALGPGTRGVLRDSLVQLVRNSLVHGIEESAERAAQGKAEAGQIQLGLQRDSAGRVLVTVRDDGRGLNLEGLREKARSMERWTAEEIAAWPDKEVAALIFTPGLSTARETDGDAGRGVGMDLVRDRIRSVGGRIETRFKRGRYCEFRLRVPEASA